MPKLYKLSETALATQFYENAQSIIEKHYLAPKEENINGQRRAGPIKKAELQDGHIESEQHGAMHVARVQCWALVMHQFIQKNMPDYFKRVAHYFYENHTIDEKSLLLLIRYGALFHDAARKNEGKDFWDEESGQLLCDFLIQNGLPEAIALKFSKAAALKDHPKKYNAFLLQAGVLEADLPHYNYIRKVIALADTLDIMRCTSHFKVSEVTKHFIDMPGYTASMHDPLIHELISGVYQIILKQQDMLFSSAIIAADATRLHQSNGSYSLPHKVAFEHAANVCSAIGYHISTFPIFKSYFSREQFRNTQLAKIAPAFNPLIHGTTSAALPLLAKTNFEMHSILDLLEHHGLAPISGELYNALLGGPWDQLDVTRHSGCFGRVHGEGYGVYNLDSITSGYTRAFDMYKEGVIKHFRHFAGHSLSTSGENSNKILISLAQALQLGADIIPGKGNDSTIGSDELDDIEHNLESLIQYYYLIRMLGKTIFPDSEKLQKQAEEMASSVSEEEVSEMFAKHKIEAQENIQYAIKNKRDDSIAYWENQLQMTREDFKEIYCHKKGSILLEHAWPYFSMSAIMERIRKLVIKPEDVFNSPSKEGFHGILEKIFSFEATVTALVDFGDEMTVVLTAEQRQFFTHEPLDLNCERVQPVNISTLKNYLLNRPDHSSLWSELLDPEASLTTKDLQLLDNITGQRIATLKNRLQIFQAIRKQPSAQCVFTEEGMALVKANIPLVFVCADDRRARIKDFGKQEYRSDEPMRIGVDITIIATDVESNKAIIDKFLKENGVHVQTMLFADLKKIKHHPHAVASDIQYSRGLSSAASLKAQPPKPEEGPHHSSGIRP